MMPKPDMHSLESIAEFVDIRAFLHMFSITTAEDFAGVVHAYARNPRALAEMLSISEGSLRQLYDAAYARLSDDYRKTLAESCTLDELPLTCDPPEHGRYRA